MSQQEHRVVITGASGGLARNFLEFVAAKPNVCLLALLRDASREPPAQERLELARVDFDDPLATSRVIERFRPTCLIHCAATGMQFPRTRWFNLIRFNLDVTINLCQCVAALPGCRFIYISTGLAYRDHGRALTETDALDTQHPYGASKAAADILVRSAAAEFNVPLTVIRPFSFTGLWDDNTRLFPTLLRAAADKKQVDLSPGDQIRDHCSARDVAAAIFCAMTADHRQQADARIYNVGSGDPSPLRLVIERVLSELELGLELNFGARPYVRYEPRHLLADISRARNEMGWLPRHNLAHAVWQLGRESFPHLKLREPVEDIPVLH